MRALLEGAIPLSQLLWQAETEGKDLSTPERRAGLEQRLKEIVEQITDAKVAEYYRAGFQERVFESFKRRPASADNRSPRGAGQFSGRPSAGFRGQFKPRPGTPEAVAPSTQGSSLVRARQATANHKFEMELGRLLAGCPEIALLEGESLAGLELKDPSLDSLRRELLNLAASGSSLEKAGVQTHFTRKGMADLLARFAGPAVEDEDPRTLFQRVVVQLRKHAGPRTGRPPDAMNRGAEST
jgi:DNA primase